MNNSLLPVPLSSTSSLHSLVEHRTAYTMNECELNIFETRRPASSVALLFPDLVLTSMLRGKKVMHLYGRPGFDYLPGESVLVPPNEAMHIDFPDASESEPTQCIALAISGDVISKTIEMLNERMARPDATDTWQFHKDHYHITNTTQLSDTINRIVFTTLKEQSAIKDAIVSLSLKELLLRLMQTQARAFIEQNCAALSSSNRFAAVVRYIQEHIRENISMEKLSKQACMSRTSFFRHFRHEFGITPLDYIQQERIRLAQQLLEHPLLSITEICLQVGFNDLNNFIRTFKKIAGCTPSSYRASLRAQYTIRRAH